jgi:hypothetical protein
LNIHGGTDQLLDRTEGATVELFGNSVGMRAIFVDHADQFNGFEFAGELVVNAGMVAPECAYTYYGNANGSLVGQPGSGNISDLRF